MAAQFWIVAGQVATLFLMMGVGFFLARRGQLSGGAIGQISHLLLYVVAPAIVIDSFQLPCTPELALRVGQAAGLMVAVYALYMVVAQPFFPRQSADTRDTLRFAMVYGNTGFMGLPLVRSVLGEEALIYCVVSLSIFNVATWTHGVALMGGRSQVTVRRAVCNPGVAGLAIGMALFFLNITLPGPVGQAVAYLGGLYTPLAMVVIGAQMASSDLGAVFRQKRLYAVSACKLLLIPTLTALLLLPLGLPPLIYCTMVLLAATPVAGVTSMFAQQFHRDQVSAAQAVTLSTLLSLFTLPCFGVLAQRLAGLI